MSYRDCWIQVYATRESIGVGVEVDVSTSPDMGPTYRAANVAPRTMSREATARFIAMAVETHVLRLLKGDLVYDR